MSRLALALVLFMLPLLLTVAVAAMEECCTLADICSICCPAGQIANCVVGDGWYIANQCYCSTPAL